MTIPYGRIAPNAACIVGEHSRGARITGECGERITAEHALRARVTSEYVIDSDIGEFNCALGARVTGEHSRGARSPVDQSLNAIGARAPRATSLLPMSGVPAQHVMNGDIGEFNCALGARITGESCGTRITGEHSRGARAPEHLISPILQSTTCSAFSALSTGEHSRGARAPAHLISPILQSTTCSGFRALSTGEHSLGGGDA